METQIVYSFTRPQQANRFLNDIKSGVVAGARASLCRGGYAVMVRYSLPMATGFSATAQALDDLAASRGGGEAS